MTTCVSCTQFSLQEIPAMARLGFGWCPHQDIVIDGKKSRAVTVSASRPICEKFNAAAPLAVSKRIEWIERQK